MAGAKGKSKNNLDNREIGVNKKLATSETCENCQEQCEKGKRYLEQMQTKGFGRGVPCYKKQ